MVWQVYGHASENFATFTSLIWWQSTRRWWKEHLGGFRYVISIKEWRLLMALNGRRKPNSPWFIRGREGKKKPEYKIATQFSKFRVSITPSQFLQQTYHHHNLLHFANLGMSPKLVVFQTCVLSLVQVLYIKHASSRAYKYSISNTRPFVYKDSVSNTSPLVRTSTLYQTRVLSCVHLLYIKHPSPRAYKYSISNTRPLVRTSTLYQTPALSCVQVLYIKHASSRAYKYSISNTRPLVRTDTPYQTPTLSCVQVLYIKHPSSRGYKYSTSNTRPLVCTSTLYQKPALSWVQVLSLEHSSSCGYKYSQIPVLSWVEVLSNTRREEGTSTFHQTLVPSLVQVLSYSLFLSLTLVQVLPQTLVLWWVQELCHSLLQINNFNKYPPLRQLGFQTMSSHENKYVNLLQYARITIIGHSYLDHK